MKRLLFAALTGLSSFSLIAQSPELGWFPTHIDSTSANLYDVQLIGNEGYIVGGDVTAPSAVMYYTSNYGASWTDTNFSAYALWSVHFVNSQIGFVATLEANPIDLIFKTEDGGANWIALTTGITTSGKVYFATDSIGFHYSTDTSEIAYTKDAGDTWSLYSASTFNNEGIAEMQFIDGIGYAISSSGGLVYKAVNDTDWVVVSNPSNENFNGLYFVDSLEGYIAAENSILITIDGGDNWTKVNSARGGLDLYRGGASIVDMSQVLGQDTIFSSHDEFANLSHTRFFRDSSHKSISFNAMAIEPNSSSGWAVADSGIVYVLDIIGSMKEVVQIEELQVFPNPSPDGFVFIEIKETMNSNGFLTIYSMTGSDVWSQNLDLSLIRHRIETKLPQGIYLFEVRGADIRKTAKVVIQ